MSGGGGEQKSTVKLPPEIEKAALENIKLAKEVGSLPYAPYFGPSVAAFSPAQEASFKGADAASHAFGMPGGAAGNMPKPQNVGGFKGYSTKPMYDQAMGQVPPEILELYNAFFAPNNKAGGGANGGSSSSNPAASSSSGKGSGEPVTQISGGYGLPMRSSRPSDNLGYYDGGH